MRPRRTGAPARRQASLPLWQCNGVVQPWSPEWLNEPFYQDNKDWYDEQASRGIINPPWSVWGSYCSSPTFTSEATTASEVTPSIASLSAVTSLPSSPSLPPTGTASMTRSVALASGVQSLSIATPTTTPISEQAIMTPSPDSAATPAPSTSTPVPADRFVTQWDWQVKGTIVAVALAIGVAAVLWGLWVILHKRIKAVYACRSWFPPPGSRPPPSTMAVTLAPFLHLPSLDKPTSEAKVMAHVGASALSIAAVSAVVGLGIFLPLTTAGVPNLSATTPPVAGDSTGRLGILTDLTLLRLLNALDPPQGSTPTGSSLRRRDDPGAEPLSGARIRLIVILVLVGILCLGILFIVWRTYAKLAAYAKRFDTASGGQSMVFIPASKATAWQGLTETGIKRRLRIGPTDEGSVAGVFAIGRFDVIKEKVRERAHVLEVLEEAEAKYIKSFPANPKTVAVGTMGSSNISRNSFRNSYLAPGDAFGSASSNGSSNRSSLSASKLAARMAEFNPPGESGSAFVEVNQRQSVLGRDGRLRIGQEVYQDDDGTFLRVEHDKESVGDRSRPPSRFKSTTVNELGYQPLTSRPQSALLPSAVADLKARITWSRSRLRKLNLAIEQAQQDAMKELVRGHEAIGWIVVGRGVASLPFAQDISGRSKEDILWENLGTLESRKRFWVKVACTGVILATIAFPFIGLAVISAPGFAKHIYGMEDLANGNGWDSAVVEGPNPAIALILLLAVGVKAIDIFAKQAKSVSYSDLRLLALKGSTYLLLVVGTIWAVALGAILFGVDVYVDKNTTNSQRSRAVADGVMFISWFCLIVVILCLLAPSVLLLQPLKLVRSAVRRHTAVTPRQNFHINRPPNYLPATSLAPLLVGIFFLLALCSILPIIAAPALLLAYLSLVVHQWLTSHVLCVTRGGMSNGSLALWLVRRLGWAAGLQPLVFGLVVLSRREWAIGGTAVGIALLTIAVSEFITIGLHPRAAPSCFSNASLTDDAGDVASSEAGIIHKRLASDHSILATVHTLLPSLGRLPEDNPLPFQTDAIDDYASTHCAMRATPEAAASDDAFGSDTGQIVVQAPADPSRGLIYPPELLQPAPTVWLPRGEANVAQQEADALSLEGLAAVVDPSSAR